MDKKRHFEFALRFARTSEVFDQFGQGWVLGYVTASGMDGWQEQYVRNVVWARARGISA